MTELPCDDGERPADEQAIKRKKSRVTASVCVGLTALFVGALIAYVGDGDVTETIDGPRSPMRATTNAGTYAPIPPLPASASLSCDYPDGVGGVRSQLLNVSDADFTWAWTLKAHSCEATRNPHPVELSPLETAALTALGSADPIALNNLYARCGEANPIATYAVPSDVTSAVQIPEINAMLVLCPGHPFAAELRGPVTREEIPAPAPTPTSTSDESFYAGTFLVGTEVQPGTYAVDESLAGCYWERLDAAGEIIDNNFVSGETRVEVTIAASDYSFHSEGCGAWRKVP